jgi:hypothetical protein
VSEDDDDLIRRLRRIAAEADAVPGALLDAARAAFGLRDLDSRVAELVRDTAVDAPATAVRGDGPRLLSFEAGRAVIECEVTARGEQRDLIGQLVGGELARGPLPGASAAGRRPAMEAQLAGNPSATVAVSVSERGVFTVRGLPAGPFRLRFRLADGSTLVTSWTSV